MQAIKVREFGLPAVLRLEEAANPQPGAGEILVKIEAVGVNPVETYIRSGAYAAKPDLPYTPGSDGAGTVKATGPAVGKFKIGDRVYLSGSLTGTYAELALCRETQAHPLWAGLSFAQGAAIGVPYPTAWRALFRKARAQKGETLFVHGGSGGVGIAAIQIARAAGLRVIASAGSAAGLKLIEEQGYCARPQCRRIPRPAGQTRRGKWSGRDPGNARQRQPGAGPGADCAARPDRRHREPGKS
jgi:NADPH2:quinone reductase